MAATKQSQSKKSWEQAVREVDPTYRTDKTVAYPFSNGRRFFHRRDPYPTFELVYQNASGTAFTAPRHYVDADGNRHPIRSKTYVNAQGQVFTMS